MTGHFEAKKHAYRQTQDGIVVSFVVHPNDVTSALALAPLGTRYMVAFAEIGDDEQNAGAAASHSGPVAGSPDGTGAPSPSPKKDGAPGGRTPWSQKKASQQAGILASDVAFQAWAHSLDEEEAASFIRGYCRVESRRDLDTDPEARKRWDALVAEFRMATGQMAEQRGALTSARDGRG